MADVQRALDFTRCSGNPLWHTLASIAAGRLPAEQALDELRGFQNADGEWHDLDPDLRWTTSTISTTQVALQWLIWIGAADSDLAARSVEFLQGSQHADGYWDEPTEILGSDPPKWMLPGRKSNLLWLTAAVCRWLDEMGQENEVEFDAALEFLRDGWDGDRYPEYNHTHWMALALFSRTAGDSDRDRQIARGCADFLSARLADDAVDPVDVTSVAQAALRAGEMGEGVLATALEKVTGDQEADGGWITRYGDRHRAAATAQALFLLKEVGALTGTP